MLSLEVVPLPVSDVGRALAFYTEQAGFTLDVDYHPTTEFRVVQLTPSGSVCSVQLVTPTRRAGYTSSTSVQPTSRPSARN